MARKSRDLPNDLGYGPSVEGHARLAGLHAPDPPTFGAGPVQGGLDGMAPIRRHGGQQAAARLRVVGQRDQLGRDAGAHGKRRRNESAVVRRAAGLDAGGGELKGARQGGQRPGLEHEARARRPRHLETVPQEAEPGDVGRGCDAGTHERLRRGSIERPHRVDRAGQVVGGRPALPRPGDEHARAQPLGAPPLRSSLSGCAAPITARPYFGSGSRIVWPPASVPPASRTLDDAPSKIAASTSRGRSSGKAAIDSAKRTRPPIANTSLNAFAAAISPNVRGSSTSGGKKSSVPMMARSSLTRYAAASSGGSRPAIRSPGASSAASAPSPESASARRSAPSLAAHPPQSVRVVRRIGVEVSMAVMSR